MIENIYLKDDYVKKVSSGSPAVLVELNYYIQDEINKMKQGKIDSYMGYIPEYKNVVIEDFKVNPAKVEGAGGAKAFDIKGFGKPTTNTALENLDALTDCYIKNFTIKNSEFHGSGKIFDLNYVDGLTLDNVVITGGSSASSVSNTQNIKFINSDLSRSNVPQSLFDGKATIENTTFYVPPEEPEEPGEDGTEQTFNIVTLGSGNEAWSQTPDPEPRQNKIYATLKDKKEELLALMKPNQKLNERIQALTDNTVQIQWNVKDKAPWYQINNMVKDESFYFTTPVEVTRTVDNNEYVASMRYKGKSSGRGTFGVYLIPVASEIAADGGEEIYLGSINMKFATEGMRIAELSLPEGTETVTVAPGQYYLKFVCTSDGGFVGEYVTLQKKAGGGAGTACGQSHWNHRGAGYSGDDLRRRAEHLPAYGQCRGRRDPCGWHFCR